MSIKTGFWFGGGARLTIANEYVYESNSYYDDNGYYVYNNNSHYEKNNYFGIMAGIGYRFYTQFRFLLGNKYQRRKISECI